MKTVTIRQALQHVVDNPQPKTDVMLDLPVYELVSRTLFEIANGVRVDDRSTMARANVARTMIFNRLVGRRKPGSHPATRTKASIDFHDLTGGALEAGE
jgi:hypothetical protein